MPRPHPSGPHRPSTLDRRAFLAALGVCGALPATLAFDAGCSAAPAPTGPDLSGADNSTRPQDDLYRHVNGTWLRQYQLPPDKSSFGSFNEVAERTLTQLEAILESLPGDAAAGSDEQKLRDLYRAALDTGAIEHLGLAPVADLLSTIDDAAAKADLAAAMGRLSSAGGDGLVSLDVGPDKKDSTRYLPALAQSGLGLPDESYYREPHHDQARTAYRDYLARIAAAAHFADPVGTAARVFDLETKIAAAQWNNVRTRDSVATYNVHSWTELDTLAPGFEWNEWLAAQTGRPDRITTVVVDEPSFLTGAARLWSDTDIATWREYLKLGVLRDFGPYLPKAFADAHFEMFNRTLRGVQQPPERWKTAVNVVNTNIGEMLGRKYVARHFPADAKNTAVGLVNNLKAAYRARFAAPDNWMSPPTRAAALEKLGKIDTKIGYPDTWRDYSALTIGRGELVTSIRAANVFETNRMLAKLGTPVDRSEWGMPPQTVNAYYSPENNQIVFPAAILQPPFFDPNAEPAVNYGGIGAVIGHEIGHAFDDQGSKYDGDGDLHDWWTPADRAAFDLKTKALIAQYNALVPAGLAPDQHVDGALTIGENLADLRGLTIALAAFALAERKTGVNSPDYTPMFFAWARIWREKTRPAALAQQLATDPHSPSEFRANQVVRNIGKFYTTFHVQPTDGLYLPEAQRVTI
jgi:putative endopeptidase